MRPRIGLALALALAAGCASPATTNSTAYRSIARRSVRGSTTHTVAPGETLYRIGRQYGIDSGRIMAANGLADPRDLRVGQLLIIPAGSADDVALPATASAFSLPNPWSVTPADRQFAWPVTAGMVSSPFGMRNGAMHDGVDIAAPAGTPVYAADDGTVIFAGRLHGYGNVVIVQHADGYTTVYGHNQHNLATVGTRVARGQQIAEIGTSGRTSGPNLHFEVRRNNQAENPLAYLPPPAATTGISFARNGGS
jgi:murein DD-endopeptidase MepM/ murein hydrolase activator NlpD